MAKRSILETHLEIAKERHTILNGDLKPNEVVAGSAKKAWWKYDKGLDHERETAPNRRASKRIVTHVVLGIKVVVTNSLSSLYSETDEEWHPTKNGDLRADEIVDDK